MYEKRLKDPYLSRSKYNDKSYIGQIFQNFKVVDFVLDKDEHFAFKCMCLCQEGKIRPKYDIILPSKLINGSRISCGCISKNNVQYNKKEYLNKEFGLLKVLEIKEDNRKADGVKFKCLCQGCNDIVEISARHCLYGRQKTCGKQSCKQLLGISSSKYRDKKYIGEVYGCLKVLDIYSYSLGDKCVYWKCQCLRDGNIVKVLAYAVVRGHNSSCGCLNSIAEVYIKEILDKYNIVYKSQYSFRGLVGDTGYPLRYDFAIFKNNSLFCLLEYDGEQHRNSDYMYGSSDDERKRNFQKLQRYDKLKDKFAKDNNIQLYRFFIHNVGKNKYKIEQYLRDFYII